MFVRSIWLTQREIPLLCRASVQKRALKRSTSMLNCDSPEDLPHFPDMWTAQWCTFFSDCSASFTPSAAKLMEKKTSKQERNDSKTWGCVCVIYGDESALRVKMHVDALHTVPTPCSLSTHTHTHTHTHKHKQTHYAAMTSLVNVKEVKVPEDTIWQTLFYSHDMYKHIMTDLLLTVWH